MRSRAIFFLSATLGLGLYFVTEFSFSILVLIFIWLCLAYIYKLEAKILFILAYTCLVLNPILIYFGQIVIVEKLAKVIYLFLITGFIQEAWLYLRKPTKTTNFKQWLTLLVHDFTKLLAPFINLSNKQVRIFSRHFRIDTLFTVRYACLIFLTIFLLFWLGYGQYTFFSAYFRFDPLWAYVKYLISLQIIVYALVFATWFFILKKFFQGKYSLIFLSFSLIFVQFMTFSYVSHRLKTNPFITALKSTSGSIWQQIAVYGHNFGNAQYNDAQIYLDGQTHRVLMWSDDKIVFVVDAFKSESGDVWIKNVDQKISNKVEFKFIPT